MAKYEAPQPMKNVAAICEMACIVPAIQRYHFAWVSVKRKKPRKSTAAQKIGNGVSSNFSRTRDAASVTSDVSPTFAMTDHAVNKYRLAGTRPNFQFTRGKRPLRRESSRDTVGFGQLAL